MANRKLPDIAPTEACMAVIGLRTIISKKVEKITKGKLDEIASLPKKISKQARQLVNNDLTETFYSDLNYREMVKDLSNGFDINQVQEMTDQFPTEYRHIGHALTIVASQVIQGLMAMVPTASYQTMTGLTQLIPDDLKLWKFISILEVLDDPLLVFPLMNTGALLRSQARAVRTLYPSLSAAIDAAIFDATIKAKAKSKAFELNPRAEVGVRAWMDQGQASKNSIANSQAAIQADKEKKAAKVAAFKAKYKPAELMETNSQSSNLKAP